MSGSGSPHARAHLSIGEVLSLLQDEFPDVTISKIRFLESQGLLDPERTPSGYRKFYDYDIERLRWILRLQKDHYLPLKVIKDRLDEAGGMLPFDDGSELAEIERQPSLLTTEVPPGPRELPEGQAAAADTPDVPAAARAQDPPARGQTRAAGSEAAVRNGRVAVTERDRERERGARASGPAAPAAPAAPSSRPGGAGPRAGAPGSGRPSPPAQPPSGRSPQDRRPASGGSRSGAANGRAPSAPAPGARGPGAPASGGSGGPAGATPQQRTRQQGTPAGRGSASRSGGAPQQGGGPGQRPAPRRTPPGPPARTRAPEPGASTSGGVGGFEPGPDAVSLTLDELAEASGLTARDVRDLERFGLIEPRQGDAGGGYDGDALVIARTAAGFLQHGIEARHMRTYKVAVDREAGLFEQIVSPVLKQRNPEARVRATRTVTELIRLGEVMRGVLLRRELRDHIGGG